MSVTKIFALLCFAATCAQAAEPVNYLFTSPDELHGLSSLLDRDDIAGAQVVYSWKSLEPRKGEYDFSRIESDLGFVARHHKQLFLQIQDRFFEREARNVPRYLLEDPEYHGGLAPQSDYAGENQPEGAGWVAMQWNPAVRERFQALLSALAREFDGRVYGINLPESSADIDVKRDKTGFTCDAYFDAELANAAHAREVFRKSRVVQYVNFWPCGWNDAHGYLTRSFAFAQEHGIGVGGPDIVPDRPGQMTNSYRFFHRYKGKLSLVAMAVQEPTLTYTNPKTHEKFTREEIVAFARDYLGVEVIFWSPASPWLAKAR